MIITLIVLLLLFITSISIYFFRLAFVRGSTFDITTTKLSNKSKLKKSLEELEENLKYINSQKSIWLYIQSKDGITLAGRFFKNMESHQIAILFHGYRSIAENDFSVYFKWYFEHGYHVLLVDQRAHGKSEGKYITFGVKEREDCIKWCQYVSENFAFIDTIILGGMSMGSATILLASDLQLPLKVKAMVADCGYTSPLDILSHVASCKYGMDITLLLPFINFLCKKKAKFDLKTCSVLEAMKKNQLPILFIHGTSDDFIPSKMSKQNFEACQSRKELVLVECVNHGLSCVYDKEKIFNALHQFLEIE